jgi:hypothetical protein
MRPFRLFIGSSSEGLEIARHVQLEIEQDVECTVWHQGVFEPSANILDGLIQAAHANDFAVLILTPDDMRIKRDVGARCPRDNLLFELGLFMGTLGRERTFMVHCRDQHIELPSDMAGIAAITFPHRSDGNLRAALGPACTKLKVAMASEGRRSEIQVPDEMVVRLLVLRYVTENELAHLRCLDAVAPFKYQRSASFEGELRRLRDLGLIRTLQGRPVAQMPPEGDAGEHVEITEEGRAFLAMRTRLESDESLGALSERWLRKARPWLPTSLLGR